MTTTPTEAPTPIPIAKFESLLDELDTSSITPVIVAVVTGDEVESVVTSFAVVTLAVVTGEFVVIAEVVEDEVVRDEVVTWEVVGVTPVEMATPVEMTPVDTGAEKFARKLQTLYIISYQNRT